MEECEEGKEGEAVWDGGEQRRMEGENWATRASTKEYTGKLK